MEIRLVRKSDCDLLYEWANEKNVRMNSLDSEIIPYEVHKEWFESMLVQNNVSIYIASCEDIAIGVGRISVKNDIATISYSIDKNYRGQGLGTKLIEMLTKKIVIEHQNIYQIIGIVKKDNYASQRVFEKNGYQIKYRSDANGTIVYALNM